MWFMKAFRIRFLGSFMVVLSGGVPFSFISRIGAARYVIVNGVLLTDPY